MATATESSTVSLVNISREKWPPRHRTYFGSLVVSSPEAGESFCDHSHSQLQRGDRHWRKRTVDFHITAREVAEDIARELNGDSGDGSFHGVFVAAGETPTEGELADARRRLEEFYRRLVASADLEWERTRNPMFITDLERRAARQLGPRKTLALRSQAARGVSRLRGKNQARGGRLQVLRRHSRPRQSRAVRPRPTGKSAQGWRSKSGQGREVARSSTGTPACAFPV